MERQKATELLRKYWRGRPTPVDPKTISEKLGLEVRPLDTSDPQQACLSGEYKAASSGGGVIFYNPDDTPRRQRFTIAHELGHHVLGHGSRLRDPRQPSSLYSYNPVEAAANRFAAELLMPVYAVGTLVDHHNITSVTELADMFEVSEPAMLYRLKNLGYVQ